MLELPPKDSEIQQRIIAELGPQAIDSSIRQAIRVTWMSLPEHKRNVKEVELVIQDLLKRALRDIEADQERFRKIRASGEQPGGSTLTDKDKNKDDRQNDGGGQK